MHSSNVITYRLHVNSLNDEQLHVITYRLHVNSLNDEQLHVITYRLHVNSLNDEQLHVSKHICQTSFRNAYGCRLPKSVSLAHKYTNPPSTIT